MTTLKIKTGFRLLIIFYSFILAHNILAVAQVKNNILMAAVFLGTLVYIIFGFLRQAESARIIAIIFHVLFQILETTAFFIIKPEELLKKTMGDVTPEMLTAGKYAFFFVLCLITAINIAAIIYLIRNKDYFNRKEERQSPEQKSGQ
ncbi:MAG: hypothetical protein PHH68_05095 [Candidatus Omnitrophica bacterium]|nr:hypothetical protein [Candidatus Omnitrophota bacterium]